MKSKYIREVRLRKYEMFEVHNEQTECAYAGPTYSVEFRGDQKRRNRREETVLARKGAMKPTKMLDVKLRIFSDADRAVLLNNSRVHFYCGSTETLAKVVLLDRDAVEKGDACMAQLRLEEEIVAKYADRFIIRFYSPLITIGGGKILEVNPVKHKRFDAQALENLNKKEYRLTQRSFARSSFMNRAAISSILTRYHKK